ncbi:MAG: DUF1445 domain-containing protein [Candidatus Latescibacteria bacterium]|nr:DUF1445 domain-containing protein [Candidatus Latescibacterota bacterium]
MPTFTTPLQVRQACRQNQLDVFANRALRGYLCVNVIFLPRRRADEFAEFCRHNPKPCPLLAQLEPGQTDAPDFAAELDIRTDLGSYDLLRDGAVVEQRQDITDLFNNDTVTFLIGSSVSFDGLLIDKGHPPVYGSVLYTTNINCQPVGPLHGKTVVTMRAFEPGQASFVEEYTSHFPQCHGAPLGRNNGAELGIDLSRDMWDRPTAIPPGTDQIFWACGVTPSLVLQTSKIPEAITYTPGHALITDIPTEELYTEDPDVWYREAIAQ